MTHQEAVLFQYDLTRDIICGRDISLAHRGWIRAHLFGRAAITLLQTPGQLRHVPVFDYFVSGAEGHVARFGWMVEQVNNLGRECFRRIGQRAQIAVHPRQSFGSKRS